MVATKRGRRSKKLTRILQPQVSNTNYVQRRTDNLLISFEMRQSCIHILSSNALLVFLFFVGTSSCCFLVGTTRRLHRFTFVNTLQVHSIKNFPSLNSTSAKEIYPRTKLGTKTIGVDHGCVRTGVAATIGYNPRPLAIFRDLDDLELSKEITQIAASEKSQQIVVGMPYEMDGTETEQANIVRQFSSVLAKIVFSELGPDCQIFFWDERCSSKEAEARQLSSNPSADTKWILDADAACIVLEHFFSESGEGAELVALSDEHRGDAEEKWALRKKEIENSKAVTRKNRMSAINARKEAMARAAALEAQMTTEGRTRKKSRKKKKKK